MKASPIGIVTGETLFDTTGAGAREREPSGATRAAFDAQSLGAGAPAAPHPGSRPGIFGSNSRMAVSLGVLVLATLSGYWVLAVVLGTLYRWLV